MAIDLNQILSLLPLAMAKPGSPQAAALMQGYQQSLARRQQEQMQSQQFAGQEQLRQAQIGNLEADNARADEQMQMSREQQALRRLTASRQEGFGALESLQQQPDAMLPAGVDPLQAQNALVVDQFRAQQAYGVPAGTPQTPLPNMTALVSEAKKRRAQKVYAEAEKTFGPEAVAGDSITLSAGEFAGMKPSALRALFSTPAVDATGQTAAPSVRQGPARALQSKDMMRGGQRAVVNFDPGSGKYFDLAGQEVTDIAPIPPASAASGPAGTLPPATMRRVDAKSRGFDTQAIVKTIQKQAEAVSFVNSLDLNTTSPADDQALIYAFAKAMDPDSVVREGEYATVQKYAQSWADTFRFNSARIFSNTQFLTPQSRQAMKDTIQKRYAAARTQYDNVRKSYAGQIDQITGQPGSGEEWLVDYAGAFPGAPAATADRPAPPTSRKRIYYDAEGNPVNGPR